MKVQRGKTLPALTALTGLTLGFPAVDRAGADSPPPCAYGRGAHSATLLRNGKVLVAGGIGGLPGTPPQSSEYLNSAEIYDPQTDMWARTGSLHVRRRATPALASQGRGFSIFPIGFRPKSRLCW